MHIWKLVENIMKALKINNNKINNNSKITTNPYNKQLD